MPRKGQDRALLVMLTILVGVPPVAYLIWSMGLANKFAFKTPWALLLLLAAPLAFWLLILRRARRAPPLLHSSTGLLAAFRRGVAARVVHLPAILRVVALVLLVGALARPQTRDRGGKVEVEGIDIVLALDLSNSMEASDLVPSRLQAAKKVVDAFIARRKSDKIGLVVFGKDAYTHCPLTLDYSVLRNMLGDLELDLIDGSATAIGNALGVSLARLRKSDAKSRVVILITDGENNAGNVTPAQAARYASAMGVKAFTILMGPREGDVMAGRDPFGRPIRVRRQYAVNPKLLEMIAQKTGGKSFLATDTRALEKNFEEILNELEKTTRKDVAAVFEDAYQPFAALALLLLCLEALLSLSRLREFP